MKSSVFSSVGHYLRSVYRSGQSLWGSFAASTPYLFSLGDHRREVTEQYPDPISSRTADDLPARTRGLLHNDIERCIGCKECQFVCPTQCIRVETEEGSDPSKLWVTVFDIDFAKCVFCGLCAESCQPGSLVHTKQYEGAVYDLRDLVASFGRGEVTPELREKWAAHRKMVENDEVVL